MVEDRAETSGKSPGEISVPVDSSLLCTLSSESHQEAASNENDKKPANYKSALRPEGGTSSPDSALLDQELYNSFHFWRTPLPEIDLDVELEQGCGNTLSPERPEETPEVTIPGSSNITMATRKELEEMIENLEPHIDDPDVKGMERVSQVLYSCYKTLFADFFSRKKMPFKNLFHHHHHVLGLEKYD